MARGEGSSGNFGGSGEGGAIYYREVCSSEVSRTPGMEAQVS